MQLLPENENVVLSDINIQWHPAFCAAAELELSSSQAVLDFQREYNLSKKPLQIDLLVIKKQEDACIENEIGHIFRQYNVLEFKSPDDGMTVDDFFKTIGYACIYKGLGEKANQIPINQLTVSLFREGYPREMFRVLEEYGFEIKKKYKGIYYIDGLFIPAQVVVTRELEGRKHRSLKILSRNVMAEDVRGFIEDAQKLTGQGQRANADAILQVSVSANSELYKELRRSSSMCEALRQLMWDDIQAEVQKGRQEGMLRRSRETSYELFDMGLPVDQIAKAVKVSIETVQKWFDERLIPTA